MGDVTVAHGTSKRARMGFMVSLFVVAGVIASAMVAFPDADAAIGDVVSDIAESGLIQDQIEMEGASSHDSETAKLARNYLKTATGITKKQGAVITSIAGEAVLKERKPLAPKKAHKAVRKGPVVVKAKEPEKQVLQDFEASVKLPKGHQAEPDADGHQAEPDADAPEELLLQLNTFAPDKTALKREQTKASRKAKAHDAAKAAAAAARAKIRTRRMKKRKAAKLRHARHEMKMKNTKKNLASKYTMRMDYHRYRDAVNHINDDKAILQLRYHRDVKLMRNDDTYRQLLRKLNINAAGTGIIKSEEANALLPANAGGLGTTGEARGPVVVSTPAVLSGTMMATKVTQGKPFNGRPEAAALFEKAKRYDQESVYAMEHQDVLGAQASQRKSNEAFAKATALNKPYKLLDTKIATSTAKDDADIAQYKANRANEKKNKKEPWAYDSIPTFKLLEKLNEKIAAADKAAAAAKEVGAKKAAKLNTAKKTATQLEETGVPKSMMQTYAFFTEGRKYLWGLYSKKLLAAGKTPDEKAWKKKTKELWLLKVQGKISQAASATAATLMEEVNEEKTNALVTQMED